MWSSSSSQNRQRAETHRIATAAEKVEERRTNCPSDELGNRDVVGMERSANQRRRQQAQVYIDGDQSPDKIPRVQKEGRPPPALLKQRNWRIRHNRSKNQSKEKVAQPKLPDQLTTDTSQNDKPTSKDPKRYSKDMELTSG